MTAWGALALLAGAAMVATAAGCDRMALGNSGSGTDNAWVCEPGYVAVRDDSWAGWKCQHITNASALVCPAGWTVGRNRRGEWGCTQAHH